MQSFTAGNSADAARAESLKWLGLAAMLIDHANAWVFDSAFPVAQAIGRIALPCFAIALALGIAHSRRYESTLVRLVQWAAISLFAQLLVRDWYPLNVLFTLAAGVYFAVAIIDASYSRLWSWLAAFVAGFFVEFGHYGVAFVALAVLWAHSRTQRSLYLFALSAALLVIPNGNHWALAGFAVALLVHRLPVVPRVRGFFYRAYAAQFVVFAVARAAL